MKIEEAIEKVKSGEFIGKIRKITGKVEITHEDLPIMSVGWSENLHWFWKPEEFTNEIKKNLEDAGIHFDEYPEGISVFINTNKSYKWVSICNFRRYGWAAAPGRNAEVSYSTSRIFANGDSTFYSTQNMEEFLKIELARLIEKIIHEYKMDEDITLTKEFWMGLGILVRDASKHGQTIYPPSEPEGMMVFEDLRK